MIHLIWFLNKRQYIWSVQKTKDDQFSSTQKQKIMILF
jgi:hypothetical protein